MHNEYDDRKYEYQMDDARERELIAKLPTLCYEHGLKLGTIIQTTLEKVESTFGKLKPIEYLAIAEGITESCWDALQEETNNRFDFEEVENGICDSSPLYLQAKRYQNT